MATFNTALQNLLALAENQALWIQDLVNALGPNRTLVIKHWAAAPGNATADDAWANGTIVWQSGLTGNLAPSNGALRTLGKVKNVTVRQSANLGTGMAVMRVSGNGNWMQASVGLQGSSSEVKLAALNGTSGLAFGSNFAIYAPSALPVDAGGDADMPYRVVYESWEGGVAGTRQTIFFDNPQAPIVFDDPKLNAQLGAVPYTQSTGSFINGDGYLDGGYKFELGIHRFRLPPSCNDEDPTKPVWQVLVAITPKDRWAGYPTMVGYNVATDSTFIRPCKIYCYKQNGDLLHVFQMQRDGAPLNDRSVVDGKPVMGQVRNETSRWRPFINNAQFLYYCSHRLKESSDARKYYAGTRTDYWYRPRMLRERSMSNATITVFGTVSGQINGYLHLLAMPEWSANTSQQDWELEPHTGPLSDPNIPWAAGNDPSGNPNDGARYPTAATGWRYEYGAANTGHDFAHAPGGQRFDRFAVPSQLTYYMSMPTGTRLQGQVPWRDIWHNYAAGFFNLAYHHVKNAKTLEMFSVAQAAYGDIGHWNGYYNGKAPGVTPVDASKWIQYFGFSATNGVWVAGESDRDGLRQYNGYITDNQHPYQVPGLQTTHFNSVAHAVSQKLRFYAMVMSWNREKAHPSTNLADISTLESASDENMQLFLRQHAWRWLQMAFAWKTSGNHPLLIPRSEMDEIWRLNLESIYDNLVVPATTPAHPNYNHYFYQGMRNLGVPIKRVVSGGNHHYSLINDDKRYYFTGVLALMRTLGCFDHLRQINTKCAAALDFVVNCYAKSGPERFVSTKARQSYGQITPSIPTGTALTMPANWAAVAASMQPADNSDMVRNADGSAYFGPADDYQRERWQYQHLLQQTCYIYDQQFPDYATPFVAHGIAMSEDFEQFVAADIASNNREWRMRFMPAGPMLHDPA